MTETKKEAKKPNGLEELGKIFTLDFNIIEKFVDKSTVNKLQEILKEEIQVAGFFMALPENRKAIFLMGYPKGEEQMLLIASKEDEDTKRIYEALLSLKKR